MDTKDLKNQEQNRDVALVYQMLWGEDLPKGLEEEFTRDQNENPSNN